MKVKGLRNTDTKQRIDEAFLALLMKKKLEGISIKDITEKAEINRATFYAHYDDKYQLFEETIYRSICSNVYYKANSFTQLNIEYITVLFTTICDYLNQMIQGCPNSYEDIIPLVRKKMIDILDMHLKERLFIGEALHVEYRYLLASNIIYDSAEMFVLKKSLTLQSDIVETLHQVLSSTLLQ